MESRWSPDGFYTKLYIVVFSIWSPGGVQVESTWNLWVRVKYTIHQVTSSLRGSCAGSSAHLQGPSVCCCLVVIWGWVHTKEGDDEAAEEGNGVGCIVGIESLKKDKEAMLRSQRTTLG